MLLPGITKENFMKKIIFIFKNNKLFLFILLLQLVYFIYYLLNESQLLNKNDLSASDSQGFIGYGLVSSFIASILIILTIVIVLGFFLIKKIILKQEIDKIQLILGIVIIILPIIIALFNGLIFPIWIYI